MTSRSRFLVLVAGLFVWVALEYLHSTPPANAQEKPLKPPAKTVRPAPEATDTGPARDDEFSESIRLTPNRKAKKSTEAESRSPLLGSPADFGVFGVFTGMKPKIAAANP